MTRAGAWLAILALAASLAACSGLERRCPPGQERLRTAQLFFGRSAGGQGGVPDAEFRRFVDKELTPRFPDGLTILEGGGRWKGEENRLIRESAKVALIVLPRSGDGEQRIAAVRQAYRARFGRDSVLRLTPPACVPF